MDLFTRLQQVGRREVIDSLLVEANFKVICEVGVRFGENLCTLLKSNPTEIVAVDIWRNDGIASRNDLSYSQSDLDAQYNSIKELQKTYPALVIIRELSTEAAKRFPDEHFDYVYLDADHSYEAVRDDIASWYPKVKRGGILAGHDYIRSGKCFPGVNRAVDEYMQQYNLSHVIHYDISNSWYTIKI